MKYPAPYTADRINNVEEEHSLAQMCDLRQVKLSFVPRFHHSHNEDGKVSLSHKSNIKSLRKYYMENDLKLVPGTR